MEGFVRSPGLGSTFIGASSRQSLRSQLRRRLAWFLAPSAWCSLITSARAAAYDTGTFASHDPILFLHVDCCGMISYAGTSQQARWTCAQNTPALCAFCTWQGERRQSYRLSIAASPLVYEYETPDDIFLFRLCLPPPPLSSLPPCSYIRYVASLYLKPPESFAS